MVHDLPGEEFTARLERFRRRVGKAAAAGTSIRTIVQALEVVLGKEGREFFRVVPPRRVSGSR
jgi:hypothetical protein